MAAATGAVLSRQGNKQPKEPNALSSTEAFSYTAIVPLHPSSAPGEDPSITPAPKQPVMKEGTRGHRRVKPLVYQATFIVSLAMFM